MGFLALLTPCVFPMIPITVSFFTHQGAVFVKQNGANGEHGDQRFGRGGRTPMALATVLAFMGMCVRRAPALR